MTVVGELQGELQGLVGRDTATSTKIIMTRPVQSGRRFKPAPVRLRKPAMAAASALKAGDFPLDDSAFKEF